MTDVRNVIVIGGGPAGSTVSTLLAQRGVKVRLFERDTYPRFHIGESLIPETYWVFKRLNMLDKMKASPFVKKYSVQFVNAAGKESAPFYFHDNKPHECSQTWQVIRSEFDALMLDNAREHGVEVVQPGRVLEVLFEGERAVGVRVQTEDGREDTVHAKVVVADDGSRVIPDVSASRLNVTVVRQEDRGFRAAAARNLGAAATTASVLCFLDADTVPEPGYLRQLTRLPARRRT